MKVTKIADDEFEIRADHEELVTLNNCMNEAINGLSVPDFATRVGVEREIARAMLELITSSLSPAKVVYRR